MPEPFYTLHSFIHTQMRGSLPARTLPNDCNKYTRQSTHQPKLSPLSDEIGAYAPMDDNMLSVNVGYAAWSGG